MPQVADNGLYMPNRTGNKSLVNQALTTFFLNLDCLTWGEFRIRERPVVTHLERPVAREYETRLSQSVFDRSRIFDHDWDHPKISLITDLAIYPMAI